MKCHCKCNYVFFFAFLVVISFSLHAVLPLLANKGEYCINVAYIVNIRKLSAQLPYGDEYLKIIVKVTHS